MPSNQPVWGIDVGRCALKAVKLRLTAEGKVEIAGQDFVEHAKILSQPDADRHELIGAALEKLLSRNDLSKDQVVVGVPGQHTLARFTKLPPVASKRIPDIVRYEADQQIPFDMDEVIWDYQTFQQEGMPDIEVGIFAMKRELIREHLLHFEQAAIEPIIVQSGPLAVYNAVQFEGLLSKETTIVLDIGAENTDLVVGTPHGLWTRTIPIGGNAFTEALVKSFKLSFAKAEGLKRTAATSKYARQIFQAMRPVFADLVQELQRSIGFYSSTHRDASIEKVVGVGNAFLLPGLQKYLQQNLGLKIEKPESFRNAAVASPGGKDVLQGQHLSFYGALGLALQGLEQAKVTSNLLPAEIAKQVLWRKKRPAFAAAAACLVLAGASVWFRQVSDTRALASDSGTVTVSNPDAIINNGPPLSDLEGIRAMKVLAAGNALKAEFAKLGGQGQLERDQTEELIELVGNKTLIPAVTSVVHEALPGLPEAFRGDKTQEQILEIIARGGVPPRGKREQVTLSTMLMDFEPDLKLFDWRSLVNVPDPLNDYNVDAAGELPGLRLRLTLRTPNQGGAQFVRDSFMTPLRETGRKAGTGFYFDQVSLISGEKIDPSQRRPGSLGLPGAGGAGTGAQPAGAVDPVTLEPTVNDWEFVVWVSVILQDYPEADEAQGEEGD
jgi:type IV pilus assembly protein PilM